MPTALVIPAKSFRDAKSRLAPHLNVERRAALAQAWLLRGLEAGRDAGLHPLYVVTDGADVARAAEQVGARVVADPGGGALARVVDAGLARALDDGASSAIVLMGDLPHVATDDLRALRDAIANDALVIAPDEARLGTNALGVPLPLAAGTRFGRDDSFVAHQALASELGLRCRVVERRGLALDVDGAAQLARAGPAEP